MRFCLLALGALGCGAASMVIKPPVQQRCEAAGLKGCPEVVDGVMLYVEGDEAGATEKLRAGAAQNSPEDVRKFAQALVEVSGLPGASQFAGPVTQIAKLLVTQASAKGSVQTTVAVTTVAVAPTATATRPVELPAASSPDRAELAMFALTAPVDPTRTETESLSFAGTTAPVTCEVAGNAALCVSRRVGPLMVTDMLALSGCPGRLFLGASVADSGAMGLRWFAEASSAGLTGARLFVSGGEWLQVIFVPNAKADPRDPKCVLTWSGFRPRMVPTKARAIMASD
jgi:hypothetical protein